MVQILCPSKEAAHPKRSRVWPSRPSNDKLVSQLLQGKPGEPGKSGESGKPGEPGKQGEEGESGESAEAGVAGK